MGIEHEKPSHHVLRTPGREDLSPWPPVGQLPFDKITAMDEKALDQAFQERHGLDGIFKKSKLAQIKPYEKPEYDGRRVELKRIIPARLEGYPLDGKTEIFDWYDDETRDSPRSTLSHTLSRVLTDSCKQRIKDVGSRVARQAALHVPSSELRRLEDKIQQTLEHLRLRTLSASDIFLHEHLPAHKQGMRGGVKFDVERGLKLFLMQIQGLSNSECANRFGMSAGSLETLKSRYFSDLAKSTLDQVRKRK